MDVSGIAAGVPEALFREPTIVRFLPVAGSDGKLVIYGAESADLEHRKREYRPIGRARFVGVPGWYGLCICLAGGGVLRSIGGKPAEVRPGSLIRQTDRPHGEAWERIDHLRELVICVDVGLGQALCDLGFWPAGDEVVHGCATKALVEAFLHLHRHAQDAAVSTSDLTRRLIDLLMLAWSAMDAGGDAAFATQARHLLSTNLEVGTDLSEIAERLGLSERQFRRRFQLATGVSPSAYRRQLRLERACRLLATMPVAAVAAKLGYADAAVFSRQFTAAMGLPPGRLRSGHGRKR
jgi:AraC-like DNA-binding protein